jgi:hypothetical protein
MSKPAKVIVGICIGIGVFVCCGIVFIVTNATLQTHEAKKTFAGFSAAIIQHRYDAAYQLTSSEFRSKTSESAFAEQQNKLITQYGALQSVSIESYVSRRRDDGYSMTVDAAFSFEKNIRPFRVEMIKVGNTWKIDDYAEE